MGDEAKSAPLEERSQFHSASHCLKRLDIPLWAHYTRVLVLDLRSPLADLLHNHVHGLDYIKRLKTGDHHGLVVFAGNEVVRPQANHLSLIHISEPTRLGMT